LQKYCPYCRTALSDRRFNGRQARGCPNCGYTQWENPSPVSTAILKRKDKVILVRSKSRKNQWSLPSGYVENGENAEEALVREVMEETKLRSRVLGALGTYPIDLGRKKILLIAFEAEADEGEYSPNEEITEIGEFTPEEATKLLRGREDLSILFSWMKLHAKQY
jgi:NADH pyrophosphatase NudC (nudix superfamily)